MAAIGLTEAAPVPAHVSMPERRVLPQRVFAAGRQSFECIVMGAPSPEIAAEWIGADLPLAENGWDLSAAKCTHLRTEFGEMTFLVERG